jgi:hypothetical protein
MSLAVTFRYLKIDVSVCMYNRNAKMRNVTIQKSENVKRRESYDLSSLCVFEFLYFERQKAKNTSDGMRIYEILYVSYFRPPSVVFSLYCFENPKKRKHERTTKSSFVVPSCFRKFSIFRRRSENTTWR